MSRHLVRTYAGSVLMRSGIPQSLEFPRVASSGRIAVGGWGSGLTFARRFHGNAGCRTKPLEVTFVLPDGTSKVVVAYEGQSLLDVAAEHHLPMEGACAGSCACSTCHVYVDDAHLEAFPEASDAENDMIDQAFFPEPNSRLGCQLILKQKDHNGLRVSLPKATRNMYVDGAVATPH